MSRKALYLHETLSAQTTYTLLGGNIDHAARSFFMVSPSLPQTTQRRRYTNVLDGQKWLSIGSCLRQSFQAFIASLHVARTLRPSAIPEKGSKRWNKNPGNSMLRRFTCICTTRALIYRTLLEHGSAFVRIAKHLFFPRKKKMIPEHIYVWIAALCSAASITVICNYVLHVRKQRASTVRDHDNIV